MPDIYKLGAKNESTPQEEKVKINLHVGSRRDNFSNDKKVEVSKEGTLKYPKTEAEKEFLPGHTDNPLAAFNYFPKKFDFINKDPEEKVVLFLRKHPITNLKWIIFSFILLISPAFITILPAFESIPGNLALLFVLGWYMVTFSYIFENFLNWYFSINIVTDERLFDVDFYNLIYRKITDANIDQIQDVTVHIGGGLRTMFNYGDVVIQTAAEIPEIEFEAVPMPDRVAKVLRELRIEEEIEKLEGRIR